jgi:hypothetical protein
MPAKKENLIISNEIKRDMMGYAPKIGQEIYKFILRLADNPNSPVIRSKAVEYSEDTFYYRLPSGCLVFWELLHNPPARPSVTSQEGEVIHILGVGFEFPKDFHEFSL